MVCFDFSLKSLEKQQRPKIILERCLPQESCHKPSTDLNSSKELLKNKKIFVFSNSNYKDLSSQEGDPLIMFDIYPIPLGHRISIQLIEVLLKKHKGLIFQRPIRIKTYQRRGAIIQPLFGQSELQSTKSHLFEVSMDLDLGSTIMIKQYYSTITDLLSKLGGLANAAIIFFFILLYPFREINFYKKLIDQMFNVCLEPEDAQMLMGLPAFTKNLKKEEEGNNQEGKEERKDQGSGFQINITDLGGGMLHSKNDKPSSSKFSSSSSDKERIILKSKAKNQDEELASDKKRMPTTLRQIVESNPNKEDKSGSSQRFRKKTLTANQFKSLVKKQCSVSPNGLLNEGFQMTSRGYQAPTLKDVLKHLESIPQKEQREVIKRLNTIEKRQMRDQFQEEDSEDEDSSSSLFSQSHQEEGIKSSLLSDGIEQVSANNYTNKSLLHLPKSIQEINQNQRLPADSGSGFENSQNSKYNESEQRYGGGKITKTKNNKCFLENREPRNI